MDVNKILSELVYLRDICQLDSLCDDRLVGLRVASQTTRTSAALPHARISARACTLYTGGRFAGFDDVVGFPS